MAEFDLTLERPGKWMLTAAIIPPKGYWFGRQHDAMSMANCHLSRDCTTTIIRLHNGWNGLSTKGMSNWRNDGAQLVKLCLSNG